jgi:hypothetical protein
MQDREQIVLAIRASWTIETSSDPDDWTPDNPSRGQCDASSFVFWEKFRGDLVLAEVFRDGVRTEHHYWNRIDGMDIDLTAEQFTHDEEIVEKSVLSNQFLRANAGDMHQELRDRIDMLRTAVDARLAVAQSSEATGLSAPSQ